MEVLRALSVVLGVVIVAGVLGSALETVVLPQRGFTRIAQFVFGAAHRIMISRLGPQSRRDARARLFAPVALVSLPLAWMILVTLGFSFIFWGFSIGKFETAIDVSGSSLFTLGFSKPNGIGLIWVTFIEATIGLGLVALLISYLPTIYGAYNERERGIYVLAPFAGRPASPVALIEHQQSTETLDDVDLWSRMVTWLVNLDQSHTSFPALVYFPSQSTGESWVASAGTILDAASILTSVRDARELRAKPGPVMVLTYGRTALVSIGRAVGIPLDDVEALPDLVDRLHRTPAPPTAVSIRREEFEAALKRLNLVPASGTDEAWRQYTWIRSGYDAALRALAGITGAEPAELTTDRPARVGRPPLWSHRALKVDWSLPDGAEQPAG